jgi:hypothetical protein
MERLLAVSLLFLTKFSLLMRESWMGAVAVYLQSSTLSGRWQEAGVDSREQPATSWADVVSLVGMYRL